MEDMIERVALELSLHDYDGRPDRAAARDVIEAMREPTGPMLDAAARVSGSRDPSDANIWRAMIDAALSPQRAEAEPA